MDMGIALILLALAVFYAGVVVLLWDGSKDKQVIGSLLLLAALVLSLMTYTTLPY